MRTASLCLLSLGLACRNAPPQVTAIPITHWPVPGDSQSYSIRLAQPAYLAVIAIRPGEPIEVLTTASLDAAGPLGGRQARITFPSPRSFGRGPDQAVFAPRIAVGGGYLDEVGSDPKAPARVTYELHPGPSTEAHAIRVLLILLPTSVTSDAFEAALPDRAPLQVQELLRSLRQHLALPAMPGAFELSRDDPSII